MKIRFLGAARKVTGSCYHLTTGNLQVLVDCGMHQGNGAEDLNRLPFQFKPEEIPALFLTHAHIDHSGLIPKLVKDGFRGRIITTNATADLLSIMLADSAHLQEKDAEWLMKKARRSGDNHVVEPLYTAEDVAATIPLIDRKPYGAEEDIAGRIRYRFTDAGHILGSGTLEIWYQDTKGTEKKIVFSGDVGKKDNPIINDPQHTEEADYVVVESTYGDRLHKSMEDSVNELREAVTETFKRGGNVIIPAFAVGRTQDILYVLNKLVRDGQLSPMDVYVDSPLAEEATKVYFSHPELFDEEARNLFKKKSGKTIKLHFTHSVEASQKLNNITSKAIIIAGGGMMEGGRIRHHLKHNLWRSECSLIIIGFQAKGTLGRHIIDGAKTVNLLGEKVAVRASVYTIGGFSAHADQQGLLEWLRLFSGKPEVFVVHGEENAALGFARLVDEQIGFKTYVPAMGETFEI
jgi:metallo-beta-lactamase family protein